MKTIIYTTLNETFLKEWEDLWSSHESANYINSPQWFLSVLKIIPAATYKIVAIYGEDRLSAVAALIEEKKYGVRCFTVAPENFVYGMPFLVDIHDKILLKAILDATENLGNLYFDNVPDTFVGLLKQAHPKTKVVETSINYYLPLEADSDGHILTSNRKELMRRVRAIEEKFTLKTSKDTLSGLEIAMAIDNKSKKKERGYAAFSDTFARTLFQNLATYYKNHMVVHVLEYEGVSIAYSIGFMIKDTYTGSQLAYDRGYSSLTPGKVLPVKISEDLAKQKIRVMDLGTGDGHIKHLLTREHRPLYKVIVCRNPIEGYYLQFLYEARKYVYTQITKHAWMYTFYRAIINRTR